jgi:hypothetical protein
MVNKSIVLSVKMAITRHDRQIICKDSRCRSINQSINYTLF